MRQREAAIRITTPELLGIDEIVQEGGEEEVTYGLTELGLLVNRFLIAGKFIAKMDEDDSSMIKIKDSFNEISLYVGTYFSDSLEILEEMGENDPVVVIGKVSISDSQSRFSKRFYAENVQKIPEMERKYLETKAALFMRERVNKISRAISTGMRDKDELAALMNSEKMGLGLSKRFESKESVDVEKFSDQINTFLEGLGRGNRDTILKEIKNFREISLEEIANKFQGKIPREELEEEIRNLMNEGEIMELKNGVYRYIP